MSTLYDVIALMHNNVGIIILDYNNIELYRGVVNDIPDEYLFSKVYSVEPFNDNTLLCRLGFRK